MRQSENSSGSSPILNERRLRFAAAKGKGRQGGREIALFRFAQQNSSTTGKQAALLLPLSSLWRTSLLISSPIYVTLPKHETRFRSPSASSSTLTSLYFTSVGLAKRQLSVSPSSSSSCPCRAAVAETAVAVTATSQSRSPSFVHGGSSFSDSLFSFVT